MLLTLYYMAATWVQAWRLSSIQKKMSGLLTRGAGLVLYREPDLSTVPNQGKSIDDWSGHILGVSSVLCENQVEAKIDDLLTYYGSKRFCSIVPQQQVDLSCWLAIPNKGTSFPLEVCGQAPVQLNDAEKMHLLIEADYRIKLDIPEVHFCELEQFGILRAWLATDLFGLILETDFDHLTKLFGCFLINRLAVHHYLEMTRIQTVIVKGEPCVKLPALENETRKDSVDTASEMSTNSDSAIKQNQLNSYSAFYNQVRALSDSAEKAFYSRKQTVERISTPRTSSVQHLSFQNEIIVDAEVDEVNTHGLDAQLNTSPFMSANSVQSALSAPSAGGRSSDSFCSLDSQSTGFSRFPSTPARSPGRSVLSTISAAYSTLSLSSVSSMDIAKPPSVLIYSDSSVALDNVTSVLRNTLHRHRYTIYGMNRQSLLTSPWMTSTQLLVVCGTVPDVLAPVFLSFVLNGGRILCLCSDFLHLVLPTFRTAEVRQHELVRFSYAHWKNVPLMHHVFCYQASPVKTRFTSANSKSSQASCSSGKPPPTPASVEVVDSENRRHILQVEVLGAEETWQTPSLLLATAGKGPAAGKIVFSQVHLEMEFSEDHYTSTWRNDMVHLEVDPSQYESEEGKYSALRQSDAARREILRDLLANHLGMDCGDNVRHQSYRPTQGYFLGRHDLKQSMMQGLKDRLKGSVLKIGDLDLQFCDKGVNPPQTTERLLPIMLHNCPPTFSTVEYFNNLQSEKIGRLVLYSEVMVSSMLVLGSEVLWHGLVVITRLQTGGKGRSSNMWISPEGCAMTTIQLLIPLASPLGQRTSLIQHITATAVASALESQADLADALSIYLKWPNDICIMTDNGLSKIGGLIVSCVSQSSAIVCNIGLGINLDNRVPTTCINEQIMLYNARTGNKVSLLSLEKFLALIYTELERIYNLMQDGKTDQVMDLYYKYWLHNNAEITVRDTAGNDRPVTVLGVDEFGFLLVSDANGKSFSVQPDGNTFDMCIGLVAPK